LSREVRRFSRQVNILVGGIVDLHPSFPRHSNSALLKCGESLLTLKPLALGPVVGIDVRERNDLACAEDLHPENQVIRAHRSS
jgi:hypothetical protein